MLGQKVSLENGPRFGNFPGGFGGTGVVVREYVDHTGVPMVLVRMDMSGEIETVPAECCYFVDPPAPKAKASGGSKRVFLVHGHDGALREKVARFLEKLGLTAVILHEQPNKGRAIIEKFIDYSDVAYAVVLLTADDVGGQKGTSVEKLKARPRQNCLFELGYFIGALGRDRVCALHEPGVEVLSDYDGVLYVTIDTNEAWRMTLGRELKAVGLPVDMNQAV